jgi:hypothetical protein
VKNYSADDFGFYAFRYKNLLQVVVAPDLDANLYWEFRDYAGVLRFTATTTSDPALTVGSDAQGDYVYVQGIPLTAFALGLAEVRLYGNVGGVPTIPLPIYKTAFLVSEGYSGYAASLAQVRAIANLPADFDSTAIAVFLPAARRRLKSWVGVDAYLDALLPTPVDADRADAVAEAEAHLCVAEGLPTWSRRLGSAGNLLSGRDGDKNSWALKAGNDVQLEVKGHLAAAERAVDAWYGNVTPKPVAVGAKSYADESEPQ